MSQSLSSLHPPREDLIATIRPGEAAITGGPHPAYLQRLLDEGTLTLAGPTWGQPLDDGPAILEAEDEDAARDVMAADPAITSGPMTGELRSIRVGFRQGAEA